MIASTWSQVIRCDKSLYLFADEWVPVGEEVNFPDDMGVSRAHLTGFLGMVTPWSAIVVCGTDGGPIRLTVEVHDAQVDATNIGHSWSEVIQTAFESRSGRVTFRGLFGEEITTIELLPPGTWAMRAHAKGRDEGHAERSYSGLDAEPPEEHLIQFWPGPNYGDLVITQDRTGAFARGEIVPDPLPRGRDRMPQEEFEAFERSRDIILPLTEKMGLSGQRLIVELIQEQVAAQEQRLIAEWKPPEPPPP